MNAHTPTPMRAARPRCCPTCSRPMFDHDGVVRMAFAAAEAVYGVPREEIALPFHREDLVKARALVAWAMRTIGGMVSYAVIAQTIGLSDHHSAAGYHRRAIALRLRDRGFDQACRAMIMAAQAEVTHANRG